ncbi:MAG TPA: hypothetical protein VGG71_00145 [Chitinophagaceae bacterium]
MKRYNFIFAFVLIVFISCKSSKEKVTQPKGDTTRVIELAVRTAFFHQNLPKMGPLFYSYHFKDSVLFTSDSLSLSNLPLKIDSVFFKVLPQDQICSMISADTNINKVPNYLCIGAFEKSDTGYYINIQSRSCLPFGGGGAIGIHIVKEKDSLIVKSEMSSSIN